MRSSRYDLAGRLTASVDLEGKAAKAVYELVGNFTAIMRPGGRTTTYEYDANGNMAATATGCSN